MPLPAGLSADRHFYRPVTMYNDLRELHRSADRRLNIGRVTDPPQFSLPDGIRPPLRKAWPVRYLQCLIHTSLELAAVISRAHRVRCWEFILPNQVSTA